MFYVYFYHIRFPAEDCGDNYRPFTTRNHALNSYMRNAVSTDILTRLSHIDDGLTQLKSLLSTTQPDSKQSLIVPVSETTSTSTPTNHGDSTRGLLICNGMPKDSEVIYWKRLPADLIMESPVSPHKHERGERFMSFNLFSGFNNARMSFESIVVLAHAMGRTLVLPPRNDHEDYLRVEFYNAGKEADISFDDIIDFDILKSQKHVYTISTPDFLQQEGLSGKLQGVRPNNTELRGKDLAQYYIQAATTPTKDWFMKFLAFPETAADYTFLNQTHPYLHKRIIMFYGESERGRAHVYYNDTYQKARLLFMYEEQTSAYRVFQHHYSIAFFVDPTVASFYKRFVRDFIRYKDIIHCTAASIIEALRKQSKERDPYGDGSFYTLHIRRRDIWRDFVDRGTPSIYKNMILQNGQPLIPDGATVFIATDDPQGTCDGCFYPKFVKDPSWKAFYDARWNLKFIGDFIENGLLKGVNSHYYAFIEQIVCSRGKKFAGNYGSSYTGYIHRLRGYHGLGEETYYHSGAGMLMDLKKSRSVGSGWLREWRAGWTNDDGSLI